VSFRQPMMRVAYVPNQDMNETHSSASSPLRIAELPAAAGLIGITLCPGKKGASQFGGHWNRDLALDMSAIRAWGATAVVTLLEKHEFETLSVEALPEAVAWAGIEWHHLPVTDVHAPDERFEMRWVYAGVRLRERLRAGERVLIHCRGGLGRAGTVAARLLVEFGATPADAIARVRAARPGAIETTAQERWVARQTAVDAEQDHRAARELACLLGGAIGDALGYRVEFHSLDAIRREYGRDGIELGRAQGTLHVSDDTQMTLFTLEGAARALETGRPVIECVREAYLDWYRTQRRGIRASEASGEGLLGFPVLWYARAPGSTCMSALRSGAQGAIENPINGSKGCGGVMRTAPLGFLPASYSPAEVYGLAAAAAALTHGHPDGYAPAGAIACACRRLLAGGDWKSTLAELRSIVTVQHPAAQGTANLLARVDRARAEALPAREAVRFGDGWVGDEALAVGLHAALAAQSFAEAVEAAANHSGDSDSTASIAGQLYGAAHGLAALPADAVYRIDALAPLLSVHRRWSEALARAGAAD
jgi:ADP-ribosyl-[dinitrogen reductase] hydrolase